MDLFDKTKLRLDSPATANGLRDLCKLGVLAPLLYVKALMLIKNHQNWDRILYKFFAIIGVAALFASCGIFLFAKWDSFQFFHKIMLSQTVFVVATAGAFFTGYDKLVGRLLLVVAMLDIGFMLFLINARYPTSIDSWQLYLQWLGLCSLWVFACKSAFVWIFAISLVNFVAILWGYQFAIPNNFVAWHTLLNLLCAFNIAMLLAIEILSNVFLKTQKQYLWITSLVYSFLLALFLAGYRIYNDEFMSFEIFIFICMSIFFLWFYYYQYPKYIGVVIVGAFVSVFVIMALGFMSTNIFEMQINGLYAFISSSAIAIIVEIFVVTSLFGWLINNTYKRKERGFMI